MKPRDQIIARMYVVLTLLGVLPIVIVSQIIGVDLGDGDRLRERGLNQASSRQEIPAVRGTIYDRAGRSLVVNTKRFDIAVDPTVAGYATGANKLYSKLAQLTGRSASYFRAKVANRSSEKYALLWRNMPEQDVEEIRELGISGLAPGNVKFTRRYNHESTLAHVLGHVDTDLHGTAGIEQQYDSFLTGIPGRRVRKVDRRGVTTGFVGGDDVHPRHGESIYLTIDLVRQSIFEEELLRGVQESGARWGSAIAMNPKTGEILALANAPTYDPNRPSAFAEFARRNRAIADQIEPGSTFKVVAAITALEENVASLSDIIDTKDGWAVFSGRTMRDTHAHGKITLAEAIAVSSNVGIAMTAEKMEPGDLYQHARDLGFGQPTYIDLPGEAPGLLKAPANWSGTTRTSMSIGYEVMATPLQILAAYGALANGGLLVQPYILAERRSFDGEVVWKARPDSIRRAFKERTARALTPAFVDVVENGTAKEARIDGMRVAGKTGTSWKVVNGTYDRSTTRATFVGYFPADDPEVVMIVVMDEAKTSTYGGVVSAPVFQRIAQRWLSTLPNAQKYFDPEEDQTSSRSDGKLIVPAVEGKPVAVAQNQLEAAGFFVKKTESSADAIVQHQTPNAGESIPANGRVSLETTDGESIETTVGDETEGSVMPDVSRLSVRQALFWLTTLGIEAKIEGEGMITKQSPAAGKRVGRQATLVAR